MSLFAPAYWPNQPPITSKKSAKLSGRKITPQKASRVFGEIKSLNEFLIKERQNAGKINPKEFVKWEKEVRRKKRVAAAAK